MAAAPSSWPKDVRPPIASYTQSKWCDTFTSFTLEHQVQEKYAKSIEALKEEARSLLMAEGNTISDKFVLIDTLERLGVAYHFDHEIEDQLEEIFKFHCVDKDEDYDLFTTALQFRLLRQHRHYVSCSVFDKFKGKDHTFKEILNSDAKGLLSLYEAAHLRIHGEEILENAVAFTTHHLKRMVQQLESPLQDQVKRSLEQPLHRGIPRIETRHYISFYEKDNSKNELLLKLAKLDFNFVQNMYKKDLSELSRWWKEFELNPKLPYARDRLVETYLWGTSYHFEPQYSYVRIAVAKSIQMLTIVDDTYDNYATIEEGDLFTENLERWNISETDQLPEYLKILYKFILTIYDAYERDAAKQGKLFAVPYAKETRESRQGQTLTGVDFYMKEHGVSMQETADKFIELTEDAWKDLNTDWMARISSIPKDMVEQVLGYARAAEVLFRSGQDGYTKTEIVAPHIAAVFVDPIMI